MQQRAHTKVGALLHVGSETQCAPTPRARKKDPFTCRKYKIVHAKLEQVRTCKVCGT